ncbi:hypothetical protein O0L34_g5445 [Tuta absoluta]|nr:hypothetical protein O0L34_g5445 [Tuta absoluta]
MPEIGPMMRALELQRLIEDKVTEWRERSTRVAGRSVADSYQQPLNFKRHAYRRKNSAEINRIIAKYSKPHNKPVERYEPARIAPEITPARPARQKKSNLKLFSKSEDNLASVGSGGMDDHPDPTEVRPPPRGRKLSKYNAKSYEDITVFVDVEQRRKSSNFEEYSILNSKTPKKELRPMLHSIGEDSDITEFPSGLELRDKSNFATSTPLTSRKTCPVGDSVSVLNFEKCSKYVPSDLRKGSSEPDILSANSSRESVSSVGTSKTLDAKKRWNILRQPFKKGTFDCLLRWRGKKTSQPKTR